MTPIDGLRLLDTAGRLTSIDVLNRRAKAWHAARATPSAYWSLFYAKRDAAIAQDRRRAHRRHRVS